MISYDVMPILQLSHTLRFLLGLDVEVTKLQQMVTEDGEGLSAQLPVDM